ncbi:hypothetical protein G5B40_06605 [Pikeienuella piscinae]|uniref:Uncharacterized protein n=1 Tax=Pikeienuella piscinae TaxID=2748098 RepID=A0A7L5BZX0_9RHOB|nr:hypothetical protein [Pikeienuella piscinae]QIE55149.1 hypothetical protein G5B40_06605 [Pikeienuella piscinae]
MQSKFFGGAPFPFIKNPSHSSNIQLHAVCANSSARGSSNVFELSEVLYLKSLGERSGAALNSSDIPILALN